MRFILIVVALLLTACTDSDKNDIHALLDQRNQNISEKNIEGYATLLSTAYLNASGNKAIENMQHIFTSFDKVALSSRDRRIQINDKNHAICEQTYVLKVFADNKWRNIVQREQLKFYRENGTWKIDSGL